MFLTFVVRWKIISTQAFSARKHLPSEPRIGAFVRAPKAREVLASRIPVRRLAQLLGLGAALLAASERAGADATDPGVAVLRSLFNAPAASASLFAPADGAGASPATVAGYVTFYERTIGIPATIVHDGIDYLVSGPGGTIRAALQLDEAGKIAALRFHDETSAANADALARVLGAKTLATEWFAPAPSRDANVARTQKIVDDLHVAHGAFRRVETRHAAYYAIFERGETHVQISADRSGRIVYLSFERN